MIIDIDRTAGKFVVRDVPLTMTQNMHAISGARHVRGTDNWTVPLSWPCVFMITGDLKYFKPEFAPDARAWIGEEYEKIVNLHALQTANTWEGNAKLLPLQRVGTAFLLSGKRAILGDDLGAGKTPMTCDALNGIGHGSILVVCPKTLFKTWKTHILEWCSDVTPIIASDSAAKRRKAIDEAKSMMDAGRRVALIMNYQSVWRHTRLSPYGNLRMEKCEQCDPAGLDPVKPANCETCLKDLNDVHWDVVIADEAHRIINVSKQTRGIWYLTANSDYVWALTGTPSRGRVSDFWSLLRLVDPDTWTSHSKFIDRYCASETDNWGNLVVHGIKPSMQEEFQQVTLQYMIRRTFDQIMAGWAEHEGRDHVPIEVIKSERMVELTKAQRSLYDEIADSMFVELPDGKTILTENGLTKMTRLLQVSSAMIAVDEVEEGKDKVVMMRPSPKVDELIEYVKDCAPEPVVVFCVNRDLAQITVDALTDEGFRCSVVHGGVDDRDIQIEMFQNGLTDVFIGTYAAASEGVTLTRSHVCVMLQRHWSMILNKQSEGRIHRFGQKSSRVIYVDIIAEDTVESRVHERYADNLGQLELIVQDAIRGDAKKLRELVKGTK